MKKLSFVLALILVLTCAVLAACGGDSDSSSAAESSKVETSKPATSKPVESTEAPVESTEAPVESTEAPVESTEAPVESTEAPVDSSADVSSDVSEEPVEPFEPIDYGTNAIKKAPGAIEIDGVISEGEYATVFEYDADSVLWNAAWISEMPYRLHCDQWTSHCRSKSLP